VQIQNLDSKDDVGGLCEQEWGSRYALERELQQIYHMEAIYWQKKSGEKWLLGDSNTSFFYKCANGRRRKHIIKSLEWEEEIISDQAMLKQHITEYYKNLFAREEVVNIHLHENMWDEEHRLYEDDNVELPKAFSLEELDVAVKEIKNNIAPGLDGFSIEFFKFFWPQIREDIKEMLDELYNGPVWHS
jgi:hypothetical protein